ncbi:dynein regulatory complex subunit 3 [Ambystoma mexicanum]|uniref:dynein regulatory complex subunit 3 n=1 Tax=Ambystoma mexicanum TaxID=8296 RepID=UPI0037E778A0
MSRLYDTTEPNVIDDAMLAIAVEEQGPQEEAGRFAKMEGIDFRDVTQLHLDFKNILKIDNLWQFKNITKLQLDNNIIEKIQGLDTLVHLVWLDLSFNNIETIEGLDALVKLEDLSLYNNRITKVGNLDTLKNLQVLSLGNNNLTSLENLVYLRSFRELRTLNIAGNPICEDEHYKVFIAAHIPQLVYLDFRLIDDNVREIGNAKYQDILEDLLHDEKEAMAKQEEAIRKEKELEMHKAAFVEFLNGPFLFDHMFAEDVEGKKLANLPGAPELMEAYRLRCIEVCQNIFDLGLKEMAKREAEVAAFDECLLEAINENQEKGATLLKEFEERNFDILIELQHIADTTILDAKLAEYNQDISSLSEALMTLEMQLVDQLEEIIKDFERSVAELASVFLEGVQGLMAQNRELENVHHEKLLETAINTLEKVSKGDYDDDLPDNLRLLLVDKDTVINAVGASHDIHLLKIDNREDELVTKVNTWASNLIKKVHADEWHRNRTRVIEIDLYIDHAHEELDNLELHDQP